MDKLTGEEADKIRKMSTERLKGKLLEAGIEQTTIDKMSRDDIMNKWATVMLTQVQPTKGAEAPVDPQTEALAMKRRELEIRELELKTKREELAMQKQQMDNAERKQHIQQENAERMQRIQIENAEKLQRMQLENAEKIQKMQMENAERDRQLRYEEIKVREQREREMLETKQKQNEYQKERDDDVMKSVLSKMDHEKCFV